MIVEKIFYQVNCDSCGHIATEGQQIEAWNEPDFAVDEAKDSFDYIDVDGKHYCPNCTQWDEEKDERVPK